MFNSLIGISSFGSLSTVPTHFPSSSYTKELVATDYTPRSFDWRRRLEEGIGLVPIVSSDISTIETTSVSPSTLFDFNDPSLLWSTSTDVKEIGSSLPISTVFVDSVSLSSTISSVGTTYTSLSELGSFDERRDHNTIKEVVYSMLFNDGILL